MFWELTYEEIGAVLKREAEQEREANLRAAMVCATLVNLKRKKGSPPVQPKDFLKGERQHMTAEEASAYMQTWAKRINAGHQKP